MAQGIDIRSKEGVLKQLETFDTPFYSVHSGKDLKFFHAQNDMDGARNLLEDTLTLLEINGTAASFVIKFYSDVDDNGKLVDKNLLGSNSFRLNPAGNSEIIGGYYPTVQQSSRLKELEAENAMLQEKIALLENDDEDEQETKPANIVGAVINKLLEHEAVQARIISGLFSVLDKVIPVDAKHNNMNASIAGTGNNENDVDEIIDNLLQHCTVQDLQKLSELPVKNPSLFNLLLTQLRAM